MMGYFVDDIADQLALHSEGDGWQVRYLLLPYTTAQKLTYRNSKRDYTASC